MRPRSIIKSIYNIPHYYHELTQDSATGVFIPTLGAMHALSGGLVAAMSSVAIPSSLFLAYGSIKHFANASAISMTRSKTTSVVKAVEMVDPEGSLISNSQDLVPKLKILKWIYG